MGGTTYRLGDALREAPMMQTDDGHIAGPLEAPVDPGLGLVEALRKFDPCHTIAFNLFWQLTIGSREATELILALIDREKFIIRPDVLHPIFFRLKSICPALFYDLMFDTNGQFPYSERLEEYLAQLKLAGIIETEIHFCKISREMKARIITDAERKFPPESTCRGLWQVLREASRIAASGCTL